MHVCSAAMPAVSFICECPSLNCRYIVSISTLFRLCGMLHGYSLLDRVVLGELNGHGNAKADGGVHFETGTSRGHAGEAPPYP